MTTKTITLEGGVYFNTDSLINEWETEYTFFSGELRAFGRYIPVVAHSITVEVPADFDPRPGMVKALEDQKEKARAEFAALVTKIDRQINELLALEA